MYLITKNHENFFKYLQNLSFYKKDAYKTYTLIIYNEIYILQTNNTHIISKNNRIVLNRNIFMKEKDTERKITLKEYKYHLNRNRTTKHNIKDNNINNININNTQYNILIKDKEDIYFTLITILEDNKCKGIILHSKSLLFKIFMKNIIVEKEIEDKDNYENDIIEIIKTIII